MIKKKMQAEPQGDTSLHQMMAEVGGRGTPATLCWPVRVREGAAAHRPQLPSWRHMF